MIFNSMFVMMISLCLAGAGRVRRGGGAAAAQVHLFFDFFFCAPLLLHLYFDFFPCALLDFGFLVSGWVQ